MKARVKGLIFVGFAAAIFTTGAMATQTDVDAKTVTSKLYVDNKIDAVGGSGTQADPYGDTTISASSPDNKAPSSQNVYKFVTGLVGDADFQPTVSNTDNTKLYVGKWDGTNNGTGTSTWKELSVANAVVPSGGSAQVTTGYVAKTVSGGVYTIGIDATKIAATSDIRSATGASANGGEKLATAWAVHGLLDNATETTSNNVTTYTTTISASSANNVYPSSRNVYEFVKSQTGGNVIPPMSAECLAAITASTQGNHCALVASWDTTNNTIMLEWTLIAQPA